MQEKYMFSNIHEKLYLNISLYESLQEHVRIMPVSTSLKSMDSLNFFELITAYKQSKFMKHTYCFSKKTTTYYSKKKKL